MNVANRKLFANRDARKKLAAMGGIMASSPELLGEAQLYQQGGTVEVPGYLDSYEDPAKAELIRAINKSANGAAIADALNSAGQGAWDVASRLFSSAAAKVGGTGLQLDAILGAVAGDTLSYMGFPEMGSKWMAQAREEAAYGREMVDGNIDLLGRQTEPFQIPEAGRRMYDTAAVERKLTADPTLAAEGGVSEPLSDIPQSIIQARLSGSPDVPTTAPAGMVAPGAGSLDLGPMPNITRPATPGIGSLPGVDVSTGAPLTMEEIQAQMLARRLESADEQQAAEEEFGAMGMPDRAMPGGPGVGLMYPPEEDRFPSEDLYTAEQQAALDQISAQNMAAQERMAMTGYEETAAENAAAAEMEREARKSAEEAAAARDAAGITRSLTEEERKAQMEERRQARTPDVPSLVETATDPDKSTAERNSAAATDALTMLGVSDAADMSPKERVQSYEKMFKEMLGEEDEDTSKEMWHNMAMIGFAIASGEDPNALTNISRGLLEGTKMMKEDRATKRKREDAITTMAIEAGMEDRRAEDKFKRDKELAGIRYSSTGTSYGADRERSRIKELIYKTPFDYPGLLGPDGSPDPTKVNEYLDQVVEVEVPESPKTQAQAEAEFNAFVKARPDLKDAALERMKRAGYSVEGLS
jgi:hypothetical protein